MWKREEPGRPGATVTDGDTMAKTQAPAASGQRIRGSIIKGELSGSEDLTIEGHVDGKIELRQHVLTVGPNGKIKAQVYAKAVVVMGEVHGNITATEKINIRENGSVDGDITAPRVAIAEGAHFRGSIDMQRSQTSKAADTKSTATPAVAPASAQVARAAHQ